MKTRSFLIFITLLGVAWPTSRLSGQVTVSCDLQENFIILGCFGGLDCIPALTNPAILKASEASYLLDSDLVLGVYQNGVARAYPHPILWWHEIVNDTLGGEMFTVSFCPLTSTGLLFDATFNDEEHTFGVTGLLYNNNLIMYDRLSGNTFFPQMCYLGNVRNQNEDEFDFVLTGDHLELMPIIETTWGVWKALYPNTTVLSDNTGFSRDYSRYPYGTYRSNNGLLLFPITKEDLRLNRKDIIFGLTLNNIERAYPFKLMGERAVLNDDVGGAKVVVLYSKEAKFAVAFYREVDRQVLNFELQDVLGSALITFRDNETGTIWNMKGEAISGPLAVNRTSLEQVPAYNAMWFAWGAFWEQPEIADIESLITSVDRPDDDLVPPRDFSLLQNFPNPFNPSTKITFELTEPGVVTLKIYDLLGREVRTLLNNEKQSSGRKSVAWDGTNDLGERVASGVYLYQLQSGMFKQTRKMILMR